MSLLKPLRGADNGLEKNLESFFLLDYPRFELLFSVAEASDPACQVVRNLIARFPAVQAKLIVGQLDIGPNPKVNNLAISYGQARHDWVLISDSNVRVEPDYLKRLVAHLEPGVGMVTAVVAGRDAEKPGGSLESVFLNTFYARGMLLLAALGRPPVVGKTMLFQKSTAARFGGIRVLARYLAEDYMAGEAMRKLNLRVLVAADPVRQHLGKLTFRDFWSRHLRWGRIRKAQAPLAFAIEPLFGSVVSGLIGAWASSRAWGIHPLAYFGMHMSIWSACDLTVLLRLDPQPKALTPLAWLIRELLAVPLWFHIGSGNTVNWRGNRLKIQSGGTLETA